MPVIRIRRGTSQQWQTSNRVLQTGELALDTTLNKLKTGNGVDIWNNLSFITIEPSEITELVQDAIGAALPVGQEENVLVTYDDENNVFNFTTGPNVVLSSDLQNNLGDYIPLGDIGVPDGVAPLDENGLVSELYISTDIARVSDIPSLSEYATETYVDTAVSSLVDSAPATLNTLNELAASLGDDPNFATSVSASLGNKLDSAVASSTYLTQVDASTTYFSKVDAEDKVDNDLPSTDYYVTNNGSGSYVVNGINNGRIDFEKGKRYRIFVYAPGHPFWIQTVSGGYSEVNVYTQGVTGAGTQDGSIIVELPQNAPNNLYYACQFHSSMAGSIYVQEANHLASKDYVNTVFYNTVVEGMEHTVSVNDIANMTEFTSNSSIIVTIPDDPTDSDFPIGSVIEYRQMGSGRIEFAPTSPAVLVSTDGYRKTRTQYSGIMLEKRASNSWILVGDIDA
jgi:hypothetical protein